MPNLFLVFRREEGSAVMAFAKIADQYFADRSKILKADYAIVLDPNLLKTVRR